MLVLSVGAASLLALFAAAAGTHRRSVDRTNTALAAERIVSELRAAYVVDRSPEEVISTARERLPESIDGYRYRIRAFRPEGEGWSRHELVLRVTLYRGQDPSESEQEFHAVLLPTYRPGTVPWTE